jgi:hypothetical protein
MYKYVIPKVRRRDIRHGLLIALVANIPDTMKKIGILSGSITFMNVCQLLDTESSGTIAYI